MKCGEAEPDALYSLLWALGLAQHHDAVLRIREGYAVGVLSIEGVYQAVRPACLLEVDAVRLTRVIVGRWREGKRPAGVKGPAGRVAAEGRV